MNGWTFTRIWSVLSNHNEWKCPMKGFLSDLAVHESGLEFFMDSNGIRFRIGQDVVYEPCLIAWAFLHWPVSRLRRALSNATAQRESGDAICCQEGSV
jgi:hypothetical protein